MNKKPIYYWLIQVLVWTTITGFSLIGYWIGGNQLNLELRQVLIDFSVIAILSILITHLLKKSLNKFIKFNNLKLIDGFNMIWLLFVFTALFYISFILYNYFMYTYIYDRLDVLSHESNSLKNNTIVFINYGIYFTIWTVFYVAIKGLVELNKSREARLQLETNLKEAQLNTLKGQINPHFMFNSLNNIRGLMLEDVSKARGMLTSLSETLRYSLTKSDVNSISLEDELEMVENYVKISKIQFENRLQFDMQIVDESLDKQIPPMIIQMLVENALKHGISNLKKGGNVSLSTAIDNNQLQIKVTNSGTIKHTKDTTQLGLQNIKKRLELLYGKQASFTLKEIQNQVVATIKIPLI